MSIRRESISVARALGAAGTLGLALVHCQAAPQEPPPAVPAPAPVAAEPPAAPAVPAAPIPPPVEPAAPAPVVVKDVGFKTPESILHDLEQDVYFVSNINGSPGDADNNGFISRVSPEGKVLELQWVDGSKPDVQLSAPKGLAIVGDTLYVTDLTNVKLFDRKTGKLKSKVAIPGTTFLNDLSAGPDGSVYVSDSGFKLAKGGVEYTGSDAVYRITKNNKVEPVLKDKTLGNPNGLAANAQGVWLVTFGSGELIQISKDNKKQSSEKLPSGQLDGVVELADGSLLISSWEGSSVLKGKPGSGFTAVLTGLKSPADIALDTKRNRLLVPIFLGDALEFHSLK